MATAPKLNRNGTETEQKQNGITRPVVRTVNGENIFTPTVYIYMFRGF